MSEEQSDGYVFPGVSAPQYTQFPDELIDTLMHRLSGGAWKVLCYITRHTFGYKKDVDTISISQMMDGITRADGTVVDRGTGLSRQSVVNAIGELEAIGAIAARRTSNGPVRAVTTYAVKMAGPAAVDVSHGSGLKTRPGGSLKTRPGGSLKSRPRVVKKVDRQQTTPTDNSTTEPPTVPQGTADDSPGDVTTGDGPAIPTATVEADEAAPPPAPAPLRADAEERIHRAGRESKYPARAPERHERRPETPDPPQQPGWTPEDVSRIREIFLTGRDSSRDRTICEGGYPEVQGLPPRKADLNLIFSVVPRSRASDLVLALVNYREYLKIHGSYPFGLKRWLTDEEHGWAYHAAHVPRLKPPLRSVPQQADADGADRPGPYAEIQARARHAREA